MLIPSMKDLTFLPRKCPNPQLSDVTTTMKALEESVLMDAFHIAEQNLHCYILFYNIAQPKMDRLKGLSLY